MPINFPTSPTLNQQYTFSGRTWIWNGYSWQSVGTAQGLTGSQGSQGLAGSFAAQGIQGTIGIAVYDDDQGIISQQVFN